MPLQSATQLIGVADDAYNDVFAFAINTTAINADDGIVDLSTIGANTKVVLDPVFPADLSGELQYVMFDTPAVVQVYVSITNDGAAAANVETEHGGDLGSDDGATVIASGSGDSTFDAADNFVVFEDASGADPFVSFVIFGEGAAQTPATSGLFDADDVNWLYELSLAPGETQSLLFFGAMSGSGAEGNSLASSLTNLADLADAGFLAGLSTDQISKIVNYGPIPEPATFCLPGLAVLGIRRSKK